jgi:hypothetical protein
MFLTPCLHPSVPRPPDQEKEEEVQRVRLKNIHLSNQLKRIEQTLRQKVGRDIKGPER